MWIKISTGHVDNVDILFDPVANKGFVQLFEKGIFFS
jgi:hypothetical protein